MRNTQFLVIITLKSRLVNVCMKMILTKVAETDRYFVKVFSNAQWISRWRYTCLELRIDEIKSALRIDLISTKNSTKYSSLVVDHGTAKTWR